MISKPMTDRFVYFIFSGVLLLSLYGCYTSFQHPAIDDPKWGEVQISDDCSECHTQNRYQTPILPDAAQKDSNWRFYSESPWWQDDMMLDAGSVSDAPEPTGQRTISGGAAYTNPPAIPMQSSPVQSLGKSGASGDDQSSAASTDDRRSVGRRKTTTTSDSESSGAEKRATRSRRSEN